jgi:phenylpropionate dioxygenase-like ring-hydroxylating dioxygenase large terminal subunit
MFINFWYVAEESKNITDKPVKVQMLGQKFALWRDSTGKVNCVSNTCSHRGGALADGRINGDCIECPYHGWTFNGDGSCVRIPSLGADAKIPPRTRVDAYPVEEKYGLVHVFLGDLPESERPPIMPVPEYEDEAWRPILLSMEWEIDYKRSIENTIDPAHNEFTHPTHGFLGRNDDYKVEDFDLIESEWGVGFMKPMYTPPLADKNMAAASGRSEDGWSEAGAGNYGPNCTWTYIHPTDNAWMHGYAFHTPVHEGLDRIYVVFMRNFMIDPKYDQSVADRGVFIAEQDRYVLEPIEPMATPRGATHEFFVPSDKAVGGYRKRCAEWEKKGWRIDVRKVRQDDGYVAYAIPSAARRLPGGWVLDTIPLLPGGESADAATDDDMERAIG